jgi:hypothetical protein
VNTHRGYCTQQSRLNNIPELSTFSILQKKILVILFLSSCSPELKPSTRSQLGLDSAKSMNAKERKESERRQQVAKHKRRERDKEKEKEGRG